MRLGGVDSKTPQFLVIGEKLDGRLEGNLIELFREKYFCPWLWCFNDSSEIVLPGTFLQSSTAAIAIWLFLVTFNPSLSKSSQICSSSKTLVRSEQYELASKTTGSRKLLEVTCCSGVSLRNLPNFRTRDSLPLFLSPFIDINIHIDSFR